MQILYETGLTGEEYVRAEAWRFAQLERCPNHPDGGCSVAKHGTYERKITRGAKIARWYCRESHTSIGHALNDYLCRHTLPEAPPGGVSRNEFNIARRIARHLGAVPLCDLTAGDIERWRSTALVEPAQTKRNGDLDPLERVRRRKATLTQWPLGSAISIRPADAAGGADGGGGGSETTSTGRKEGAPSLSPAGR